MLRSPLLPLLPLLAWLTCLAGAACSVQAAPRPRNVLLISIDTLRADALGCYGAPRDTSPALDAFAESGALFTDVTATSPWTLPSHASLLTGLYPRRSGLTGNDRGLDEALPTLTRALGEHGLTTASIVNSRNLGERYGLHRDFEHHYLFPGNSTNEPEPSHVGTGVRMWLEEYGDEPFFLFLHYYDVHSSYTSLPKHEAAFVRERDTALDGSTDQLVWAKQAGREFASRDIRHLRDLYHAGVRQMDEEFGSLVSFLEERDLLETTLIVVTSDHGEEFYEHGSFLHGITQYQEVLHVPLLIRGPGVPAGSRFDEPVSLVDVMPTVLSLVGALPEESDGLDLSALWRPGGRGLPADRFVFGEADHDRALVAVRRGPLKLIRNLQTGASELFDLAADPGETTDRSEVLPHEREVLARRLDAFLEVEAAGVDLDRASREHEEAMRALGY